MKKILIKISALAAASLILTSCFQDYLDPIPKISISDLTAFETAQKIEGQVLGLYQAMRTETNTVNISQAFLSGRTQIYLDIKGDDFWNLTQNQTTAFQTWQHNVNSATNEVQNTWGAAYAAINKINTFLEGLDASNAVGKNIITEAKYKQYKGEALSMRAIAYFYLAQLYARPYNQNPNNLGLVLRLTAQKSSADNDKARSTIKDTYDQILTDLNAAEPLLPMFYGTAANSVSNVTRIHRNTIIAFKTRVYLHMNNFTAALTEGNKIVSANAPFSATSGVTYSLAPTFASIFLPPYATSESIFSIAFTSTELPGTQNGFAVYYTIAPNGNQEYPMNTDSPNWKNTTDFPLSDARRQITRKSTVSGIEYTFLHKYPLNPNTDYAPIMRYAEVLLNVAEAEAKVNGVNQRAVSLLNAVHSRSESTKTYSVSDFANADAFIDQLLKERNMEFIGEGIRAMDITRKLKPFPAKGNTVASASAVQINDPAYVWPIPQTEMSSNSLIVQNQ